MKYILFFLCLVFFVDSYSQNRSDTIHVAHYDINLSIVNLSQRTIAGYTDLKIVPRIFPLSYCDLDMTALTVDSVFHENQAVVFTHSDSRLRIIFNNDVTTQDTQLLRVYYHGTPATDPAGGGFYFTTTMAFNFGAGFSVLPPSLGRTWFPCLDEFTDKSTYIFCIQTDSDKIAVCGGELIDSTIHEDGTKSWKWELTSPIPTYLASIAVGDFQCYKDTFHGIDRVIPIEIYATAPYINNVPGSFVNLKTVLRDYEARLGAYAWQRVGYVAVPFNNGAMEHATNITYPQFAINGNTQYEFIIFHELAHAWFGNLLTCSAAQTMWINEGFASYAEAMADEALDPTLARYKNSTRERHHNVLLYTYAKDGGYFALDSVPQNKIYGSTSYDKGALVVHTLRHYLGDSLFFSGLRTLFQQNAYGNVNSKQFFNKMSQITGIDLTDFYLGWVHQPGFLHFSIDSVVKNEQANNLYRVYFKQKLHHAYYFADNNKIDVEFISPQGERHTIRHIQFSGEEACVDVALPFMPISWVIDPDEKIGDAVIKYVGEFDCTNASIRLDRKTVKENATVRVEYHLVAPDPLKNVNPNIFKLSDNHYWHIEYYEDNIYSDFSFFYNANLSRADYNLFQGYTKNDLILLYRRNAAEDWQIHPSTVVGNNFNGTLTTSLPLSGEYTLAMGINNVAVHSIATDFTVSIHPNPVNYELKITNYEEIGNIAVYDIVGRNVGTNLPIFLENADTATIDVSHLAQGMYFLKINNKMVKFVKE